MAEIVQDKHRIDRSIACEDCKRLADGATAFIVKRAFRTPNAIGGGIATVSWTPPLTVRVTLTPPPGQEPGEWGYPLHAYLVHPEARNSYALLCAVQDKVERKR